MIPEVHCRRVTASSLNVAVPWVLMSAYLYYHRDTSIISDGLYDGLAGRIRAGWDTITHPHRDLLRPLLGQSTSSLFDLKSEDYPWMCRAAACRLAQIDPP